MSESSVEWKKVIGFFKRKFTDGEHPDMDTILFLIGVQELGGIKKQFTRDDKINLMHVATCKLLEPFGYYKFEKTDHEAWPHYQQLKSMSALLPEQQDKLIKDAIIRYFKTNGLI